MAVKTTRRMMLSSLASAGAALTLVGCGSTQKKTSRLPGPLWPEERREAAATTPPPETRAAIEPAPTVVDPGRLPQVMSRRLWTREVPILSRADRMGTIDRITVHHAGLGAFTDTSRDGAASMLEIIRRAHVNNGWADIGYHFVIDPAGRVWEGRTTQLQGAHVKYNNERNLGIMLLGNFEIQSPSRPALASLNEFLRSSRARYRIPARNVFTHKELRPTLCPGVALQSEMDRIRSASA
ncbi:MAG: N-acetylmuramoyl-L-alanine amidase [Phycisphaerales bacterium]|nr:N-acetylmuramoyl-L-alanine amidase [Phycisphaerales bacterium]